MALRAGAVVAPNAAVGPWFGTTATSLGLAGIVTGVRALPFDRSNTWISGSLGAVTKRRVPSGVMATSSANPPPVQDSVPTTVPAPRSIFFTSRVFPLPTYA